VINGHFGLNFDPTVVGGGSLRWFNDMSISAQILIQSRETCSITYLFDKFCSF